MPPLAPRLWPVKDFVELIGAIGEQPPDLRRADAARLRVGGIQPKVVPENQAAGFKNAQHIGTYIAANL